MSPDPYQNITPSEALALSHAGQHTFIDVRTVAEFEAGHVEGSYNVPVLFRGPGAASPNLDFVDVIQRHFAASAPLVLV